jgi:uridine kinase
MDMFYPELDLSVIDITKHNFDEPAAIDNKLFLKKMMELVKTGSTKIPLHDFATTKVTHDHTEINEPKTVIIEGMMLITILSQLSTLLSKEDLLELNMTVSEVEEFTNSLLNNSDKFFVKVVSCDIQDNYQRFLRRVKRDMESRGRTPEQTKEMWENFVKHAHEEYVKLQEELCDSVIYEENFEKKVKEISVKYSAKKQVKQDSKQNPIQS